MTRRRQPPTFFSFPFPVAFLVRCYSPTTTFQQPQPASVDASSASPVAPHKQKTTTETAKMLPQQQPGTPIKAATAPGAASSSSLASGAQEVHRRNLLSLGGSAPFGLTVFWVVIAILGSILQLAGLVRVEKREKGDFETKQKQLDTLIIEPRPQKKKKKKLLRRPLSSPTRTATESRTLRSRPTTRCVFRFEKIKNTRESDKKNSHLSLPIKKTQK